MKATFHQPTARDWGPTDAAQQDVKLATECHAVNVGLHKTDPHADTCSSSNAGKYGCRMHMPRVHGFGERPQFCQMVMSPEEPTTPAISLECPHGCPTSDDVFFDGKKCKFRVCQPAALPPNASLWPIAEEEGGEEEEEDGGEEADEHCAAEASDVASSSDEDEDTNDGAGTQQMEKRRAQRYPGTSQILPNQDKRSANLELGRKEVRVVLPTPRASPSEAARARLRSLLRRYLAMEKAAGDGGAGARLAAAAKFQAEERAVEKLIREAKAIGLVREMARRPEVQRMLKSPAVNPDLKGRLENMSDGPLAARLVARWRSHKVLCRNALLMEYNELITSLLGCNTAPIPMGCSEGAKSAMFYMIKYVTKDSVAVRESLAILVDAKKHIELYPSTAEDSGEAGRTARHFVERCVNQLQQEISDTQAAACLLGRQAHASSVDFKNSFPWEILRHAKALCAKASRGEMDGVQVAEGDDDDDDATEVQYDGGGRVASSTRLRRSGSRPKSALHSTCWRCTCRGKSRCGKANHWSRCIPRASAPECASAPTARRRCRPTLCGCGSRGSARLPTGRWWVTCSATTRGRSREAGFSCCTT